MNWLRKFIYNFLSQKEKDIPNPESYSGGVETSPLDDRDYISELSNTTLPQHFSLRPVISQVETQGSYNSCVACSITTAIETITLTSDYPHYLELSKMHLWNEARKKTWGRDWKQNRGVLIRDGWKAAQNPGLTIEKLFPYTQKNFNKSIHKSFLWRWHPQFKYYFIRGFTDKQIEKQIKQAVFENKPVVFGIRIDNNFLNHRGKQVFFSDGTTGLFSHAMLIIGWDDERDCFEIQNSWGKIWGNGGKAFVDKQWILEKAFDISYAEVV